ncbi:MAG TPA: hypothetical protein VN426_14025 [Syntrophomonadaceae bacterium]|nr:hypothetical protein [Syntrophomonadaceae bacterium]
MKSRCLSITLALLILVLSLTACSSTTSKDAGQTPASKSESKAGLIDPTKLITQEEATQALGEASKAAELKDTKNPLGQKLVLFNAASEKSFKLLQLSFIQNEGLATEKLASGYTVKQLYTDTRKNLQDATDLPGLGDQAFWVPSGLHVLKGNVYFSITLTNLSKPDNLEKAKIVAQKVLSRL